MNIRTPLVVITASAVTLALTACGDDDDNNGIDDTVNVNTEVSVLTNDPNVVNTTVPFEDASIPAETQSPTTTGP